jgi:2-polyprenyl-3-methyl-5-hydroxy-6-metoxy-1,4-benzoquinol methylase
MENEYFNLRNITPSKYKNTQVPYYIKKELNGTETILDFGCGFGQLISAFISEGFHDVYGCDINEEAIKYCKSNGLKIYSNIEEINIKFDVIVMSHVLEHIDKERIIPTLQILKEKLLNVDGKIFILVPNAQSNTGCYWRYEDWTHNTLFTSGSLSYVVRAAEIGRAHV